MTVQAASKGLKSVQVTQATNATFEIGSFTSGTTSPVMVTFTKINQAQAAIVAVQVTDMASDVIRCDPIQTLVASAAGTDRQTFHSVPSTEHFVVLTNSDPGLKRLVIEVNGERFTERHLRQGEQVTLDVQAAMRPTAGNSIRLVGYGKRDASAEVLISDQPCVSATRAARHCPLRALAGHQQIEKPSGRPANVKRCVAIPLQSSGRRNCRLGNSLGAARRH